MTDNTLLLIAAVARQAWSDAQAGSKEATEWLNAVAPDWREWAPMPSLSIGARTDPPVRVPMTPKHNQSVLGQARSFVQPKKELVQMEQKILGPLGRRRLAREYAEQQVGMTPAEVIANVVQPSATGPITPAPPKKLFGKTVKIPNLISDEEKEVLTDLGRKVLGRLRISGQWHTPGQIADALGIKRSSMSKTLGRLLEAGVVERRPIDPDGKITDKGYAYHAVQTKGKER